MLMLSTASGSHTPAIRCGLADVGRAAAGSGRHGFKDTRNQRAQPTNISHAPRGNGGQKVG